MPKPKFVIARDLSSDDLEQVVEGAKYCDKSKETDESQWDNHKENIQPLTKGRKIDDLIRSLQIIDDNNTRKELLKKRKLQFDQDLKEASEDLDKQLDIWHHYIDWLQQNVPDGGKVNNITEAIEQCIEIYYDKKQFKQDNRLFNIFMKFKHFCDEPIEIFGFMYANSISILLAKFYLNWSWQYEMRKNMKRAEDLIKLGLKNLATPREALLEAESQIKSRIERMIRSGELNDCPDLTLVSSKDSQRQLAEGGIRAALQTLKVKTNKKNSHTTSVNGSVNGASIVPINRVGNAVDTVNVGGLKSQTKLVNGVPVAKTKRTSSRTGSGGGSSSKSGADKKSNKPIEIYSDHQENVGFNSALESIGENGLGDENAPSGGIRVASQIMKKIPTSQRIQSVGRTGLENQIQSSGVVQCSGNSFKVPLSRR